MKRILKVAGYLILACLLTAFIAAGVSFGSWLIYEIGAAVSDWLK